MTVFECAPAYPTYRFRDDHVSQTAATAETAPVIRGAYALDSRRENYAHEITIIVEINVLDVVFMAVRTGDTGRNRYTEHSRL